MKTITKKGVFLILSLAVMFFCGLKMFGAPHSGEIYKLKQPDGTVVAVRVYGDEYYQDVESLEGYTLVRDEVTGWICYAELSANGNAYVSTGVVYDPDNILYPEDDVTNERGGKHLRINKEQIAIERAAAFERIHGMTEAESRNKNALLREAAYEAKAANPEAVEYVTGLTLIVDFSDEPAVIPRSEIEKFCNQEGYSGYNNHGSVKDYFYDVSNGKFVFTNVVTQYLRMPYPKNTYYDTPEGRPRQLVVDALKALERTGFNFNQLSTKSGRFTSINIFYAGAPNHGWSNGLWPHQGSLYGSYTYTAPNGIKVVPYEMSDINTELSLFTFCHENGHLILNWDDLYAYDGHSNGIGKFGLMCGRLNKYPLPPNPYFSHMEGWVDVTDITGMADGTVLSALRNDTVFRYRASSSEYFYIENRAREGRSYGLRGDGLVIWHVNRSGSNTYSGYNDFVAVEQADGKLDIERKVNHGDTGDFFRAGFNSSFSDNTSPSAKLHSGYNSGLDIRNISSIGSTMTFSIGNAAITPTPTFTPTVTQTPSVTVTPTFTPTITLTPTATPTVDPIGSTWDPAKVYNGGERVKHNGFIWEAKWWTQGDEPGADEWGPWKKIGPIGGGTPTPTPVVTIGPTKTPTATPTTGIVTPTPTATSGSGYPAWALNTTYTAGDIVTYNGSLYKAIVSHTAYSDSWNPADAPTLWSAM